METQPDQLETADKYLQENSLKCKLFIHPAVDVSRILIADENNKVILVKEEPTEDFFKGKIGLLNLRFLKTFLVISPKETVLTPLELYEEGNYQIIPSLESNTYFSIIDKQECIANFIPYENQESWLSILKDAQLLPSSKVMINYLTESEIKYKTILCLNFFANQFEAILLEENSLKFYNKFSCSTPDEFNFFILTLFEKLSLPAALIRFSLWGEIVEGDENYKRLSKYSKNLSFPAYNHPVNLNLLIAATECV